MIIGKCDLELKTNKLTDSHFINILTLLILVVILISKIQLLVL